jgi:RimJ/RimL family protein N-acetyltransferase
MTSNHSWARMLPLDSSRLVLRRFSRADVQAFLAYRNDPEVARFQGWDSFSLAEATAFVARQEKQPVASPGQWLQIAIALKQTGQLVGDCALKIHMADARQATIGITLCRAFQGQGLATEALAALLDFVFLEAGLHRVQADTDPENVSARKLLEHLGMRQEAHCRQSLWFKGRWVDECFYAILRHEWQRKRSAPPSPAVASK